MQPNTLSSNLELDMLLLDLEYSIQQHDKYYDYSDDYTVVKRGESEWKHIQNLANELKLRGYAAEVQRVFDKYYNCK